MEIFRLYVGCKKIAESSKDRESILIYERGHEGFLDILSFGKDFIPYDAFLIWLKSRCPDPGRLDLDLILNKLGLDHYDPIAIVRKTNGIKYPEDNVLVVIE